MRPAKYLVRPIPFFLQFNLSFYTQRSDVNFRQFLMLVKYAIRGYDGNAVTKCDQDIDCMEISKQIALPIVGGCFRVSCTQAARCRYGPMTVPRFQLPVIGNQQFVDGIRFVELQSAVFFSCFPAAQQ